MTSCRYDRDRETYIRDGEPCKVDESGWPTYHCKSRRSCSNHIGFDQLTCPRCLGRTRSDVRSLPDLVALMPGEAIASGVVTKAPTMLAGPTADMDEHAEHREALWHRLEAWERLGRITARQFVKEVADERADDESHPANVLGIWCRMWAEDYELTLPDTSSLTACVTFVDSILHRVAQDPEQDFPLFAREVRACRTRMESVIRNSRTTERGAPCPICAEKIAADRDRPAAHLERAVLGETKADTRGAPRLELHHGHWCTDEECTRDHYPKDPDVWVCPRDRDHTWEDVDYRRWVADVYEANRGATA